VVDPTGSCDGIDSDDACGNARNKARVKTSQTTDRTSVCTLLVVVQSCRYSKLPS